MKRHQIRLVAPFLPLPVSNAHHAALGAFDWMDAIRMLSHSAQRSCGVPVQVLTDLGADLPVACLRYPTVHRRLMLWVLEVCVQYLDSPDFDRDTVCLDCDQLVHRDLARWFSPQVDLGLLLRSKLQHEDTWKKVINGVQFWAVKAKARLVAFYREALATAETLGEDLIRWGGDTQALRLLLEPMSIGLHRRHGVRVHLIDAARVSQPLSQAQIDGMAVGRAPRPVAAVTDFRYQRKRFMRQFFDMAVCPQGVVCVS
mgnify:CR=1 FL=1